jgi:hypothetical protein
MPLNWSPARSTVAAVNLRKSTKLSLSKVAESSIILQSMCEGGAMANATIIERLG